MYAKSMMNGIRFPPPASESLVNAMRCGKIFEIKILLRSAARRIYFCDVSLKNYVCGVYGEKS
jgi:hypothetical protein